MGQNFQPDTINQTLLFPPSLHDWLPDGHLARFLVDVVAALDLGAIYASYAAKDGRGQAAYSPEMMVRLLLYGCERYVNPTPTRMAEWGSADCRGWLSDGSSTGRAAIARVG